MYVKVYWVRFLELTLTLFSEVTVYTFNLSFPSHFRNSQLQFWKGIEEDVGHKLV